MPCHVLAWLVIGVNNMTTSAARTALVTRPHRIMTIEENPNLSEVTETLISRNSFHVNETPLRRGLRVPIYEHVLHECHAA